MGWVVIARAFWYAVWLVLRAYAFTRPSVTIFLGGRYLRRWFLTCTPEQDASGTPGRYLHEWHSPDPDRRLHNHPWEWAYTRVLRGGYTEARSDWDKPARIRVRRVGDRVAFGPSTRHRVAAIAPNTWTLFHAGPKHGRGWGPKGEGYLEWHAPEWRSWGRK